MDSWISLFLVSLTLHYLDFALTSLAIPFKTAFAKNFISFWHLTVCFHCTSLLQYIFFLKYLTDSEEIRSLDTIYLLMTLISNLLPRFFSEDPTWCVQLSTSHLHFGVSWVVQICCLPDWTFDCPPQICSSTSLSQFSKWDLRCSVSHAVTFSTHQPLTPTLSLSLSLIDSASKIYFEFVCFSVYFSVLVLTTGSNLNYYNCSLTVSQLLPFSSVIHYLPSSHRGLFKMQIWSYHFSVNPFLCFLIAFRIKPTILNMP